MKKYDRHNFFKSLVLFIQEHKRSKGLRGVLISLASITVFTTTYALILPALTLEKNVAAQMPGVDLDDDALYEEGIVEFDEFSEELYDPAEDMDGWNDEQDSQEPTTEYNGFLIDDENGISDEEWEELLSEGDFFVEEDLLDLSDEPGVSVEFDEPNEIETETIRETENSGETEIVVEAETLVATENEEDEETAESSEEITDSEIIADSTSETLVVDDSVSHIEEMTEPATEVVVAAVTKKIVKEATEEIIDSITEKIVEITTEAITERTTEAVAEEITEELTEEATEEIVETVTEALTETAIIEATEAVTVEAAEETTEEVTEAVTAEATEVTTEEITERVTETVTEEATEAASEKTTEEATEVVIEEATEEITEGVTETATETVTEEVTEAVTEEISEKLTEEATEAVTEEITEEVTEEATEVIIENAAEATTEDITEEITEAITEEDVEQSYPAQHFEVYTKYMYIQIVADEGAFPEDTTITIEDIEDEETLETITSAVEGNISRVHAVDITFWDARQNEIEPLIPIRVTMTELDPVESVSEKEEIEGADEISQSDETPLVVHLQNDGETQLIETKDSAAAQASEQKVAFEASSFSIYALVYTVDFHYSVDGKMYEFSIPGGGFVTLQQLVEVLGIANNDIYSEIATDAFTEGTGSETVREEQSINENAANVNTVNERIVTLSNVTVSEAVKSFVADVASVEFSSPELVWVGKIEESAAVGELKETNGLECEYSAELTEEQIAEINAQSVEAGDWALISLCPFDVEELLTVAMKDGEIFTIRVTDEQIKKTVISDSGETWEITVTYGPEAQIPDGAELKVTEILPGNVEYQKYYDESLKKIDVFSTSCDTTEEGFLPLIMDAAVDSDSSVENSSRNTGNQDASGDTPNEEVEPIKKISDYARVFDIQIWADDQEIQPKKEVTVDIKLIDVPEDKNAIPSVVHFAKSGTELMELEEKTENSQYENLQFITDEFSVYSVIYTVDFLWNVNGRQFYFSIPGGGFVSFTDLVELLGLATQDISDDADPENYNKVITLENITVSEAACEFVNDVDSIVFSTPSLLSIEKVEKETTVGEIKESLKLECEYSAELTEEQIESINGTVVKPGDWALISLQPFNTSESLDVKMKTGESFTILVTDAQTPVNLNTSGLSGFVTLDMFDYYGSNANHTYDNLDTEQNHLTGTTSYDGAVNSGINQGHDLKFMGYGTKGASTINHFTGSETIRQGIVQGTLDGEGYPKLASGSKESLKYLFEQSDGTGRKYYGGVQGLFYKGNSDGSYNENGSYYAYDSDRYYAYLNNGTIQHHAADIKIEATYGGDGSTYSDGTAGDPIGFFPFDPYNSNMTCPHPRDVTWYTHTNHYYNHPSYNHSFGLTMSAQFEMPLKDENGNQTVDGNHMIFNFSGDDDMWVFIDDVLVLDIGGIHHPSSGYIDFTNGTVTVNNSVTGVNGATNGINQKYGRTASIKSIFEDAGKSWITDGHSAHTIKVFYLERGGIYSNCKITFNLPLILGKGTVSIVKKDANPENTQNEGKLEGAIFGLWKNPECTGDPFVTRVSGSNGMCTFADLSVGDDLSQTTYYMKEIKAPYGYKLDDTIYTLKLVPDSSDISGYKRDAEGNYIFQLLGQDGTSLHVLEQEPHFPYIENEEAKPIGLKVQKMWQKADNTTIYVDPPAGVTAKFRVQRYLTYDVVELGADNIHRIIRHVRELDTEFNGKADNVVELPMANSDTPWEYVYNNLKLTEQGSVTIDNKTYPIQYYYEYYIEEAETPEGYETIYLDDDNQELFGEHVPSELATDEDDQTQTIINRKLLNIPAQKYWDDFLGDGYDWTATLQLDYRDIPIPTTGVDLSSIEWQEYHPREPDYCKQISKASPSTVFEGLPMYITDNNGNRCRREYSIVEVAYTVTRLSDNATIFQYDKDEGVTIPQGDTYTPWFDHDAGEDDDYNDDIYPGADDYNIVVHNLRENRNIQKDLRLSIEKEWPSSEYSTSSEAKAVFRLRRYILTEYRNYEGTIYASAPKVVINLSDGTDIIETLTVPQGVPMSIHGYLKPGANGNIAFDPELSYSADNPTSEEAIFDIRFVASENMTLTLANGEDLVVGGASGFRFKEMEGTTQPEELDNSFLIEFELSNGQWSKSFPEDHAGDEQHHSNDVLPAVEVSVLDANGNTANTYVYKYFFEEIECTPSSFNATFTDSEGNEFLGDKDHLIYFDTSVTATNRPTGLDLLKVDKNHPENVLSGAEFQLRKLDVDEDTGLPYKENQNPDGPYVGHEIITPDAEATDSEGIMVFKPDNGLALGYYELLETHSPDGYIILDDPAIYLKVEALGVIKLLKKDDSGSVLWDQAATEGETVGNVSISSSATVEGGKTITVTVPNTPGAALPNTGGPGTDLNYLIGIMLTGIAGTGLVLTKRRRRAA